MANENNGRDRRPVPPLDSDLIDYSAYERQSGMKARGAQAPGGFVPATGNSRGRRPSQSSRGTVRNAYATAGAGGQHARSSAAYQNRNHGMSTGKKVALAVVIIGLVALVAGLAYAAIRAMTYESKDVETHGGFQEGELVALEQELTGTTSFDEPFTVLLLGSDARSDDPDMGARTDTIVLCRVDTSKSQISMMSIPRDTMVDIEDAGINKINAAYYFGGAAGAVKAVRDLTGVEIDHFAEINFEELVGLIDAMGGIDVEVEETIDDPDAGDEVIEAGMQHLNGAQALTFSRSRAYTDGDYTRQRNQRKVIDAIIQKGLNAPAKDLTGIIDTSLKFIKTDMKSEFIKDVADQIRHNYDHDVTIYSANIPSQPAYVGDTSYVIADTAGVAEMVRIFMEGGDISQDIEASSISSDIAAAGGSSTPPATTNTGYYY